MSKAFKEHCLLPFGDIYVSCRKILKKNPNNKKACRNIAINNLKSTQANIYDKQLLAAGTMHRGRKKFFFFSFVGYMLSKKKILFLNSVQLSF